jgi:hypothetical protein
MVFVESLQLEMPGAFPAASYAGFMESARAVLLDPKGPAWTEFAGASNLIGWRFRSSHEDFSAYLRSWNRYGAQASLEEVYRRERWLFGMFSSGVSCLETACYGIYALASHPSILGLTFGPREQFSGDPKGLREALSTHQQAATAVSTLESMLAAAEWQLWTQFRNRMAHRSNLPRVIKAAIGAAPQAFAIELAATTSSPALVADEVHLESLFDWLAKTLTNLLDLGRSLAHPPG